mmetsp:Transcript_100679/g.290930  ORF Transcript_100679/g.290930 Transcript_100679/m.290930 type:complete len:267 (-) Transcript_100679:87-887(-)
MTPSVGERGDTSGAASPNMSVTDGGGSAVATTVPGDMPQPPPPELIGGQDTLKWKREYNIRQREADWKRKQEEMLTQKQVAWQIEHCERENRLTSARESRLREELEGRVYKRHLEIDRRYKERCRNAEIEKRNAAWEQRENARLVAMHRDSRQAAEAQKQVLAVEKQKQFEELRAAAAERAERRRKQAELDAKREENIRKREAERLAKAAEAAQKLKTDDISRSNLVVDRFTQRTLTSSPEMVGILARHPTSSTHNHDGATPGCIL